MSARQPSRVASGVSFSGEGRIAVVIPCHNEQSTVARVVRGFREMLPEADVIVIDNASIDDSATEALSAGARVVGESRLGKGFALLRGFEVAGDVDYCVMVDGDDTYSARDVRRLLEAADDSGADMVIGTRLASADTNAFRPAHGLGNRLFIGLVRALFGFRTADLFSGYRVLSGRYLRNSPLVAEGFEVEAELSVQAHLQGFRVVEVPVEYRARPPGSSSKLRTLHDGYRILRGVLVFFRDYRPLAFFGWLAVALILASLASGYAPIDDYLRTGLVYTCRAPFWRPRSS